MLIAYASNEASNEGSDKPVYISSITTVFATRKYPVRTLKNAQAKNAFSLLDRCVNIDFLHL